MSGNMNFLPIGNFFAKNTIKMIEKRPKIGIFGLKTAWKWPGGAKMGENGEISGRDGERKGIFDRIYRMSRMGGNHQLTPASSLS